MNIKDRLRVYEGTKSYQEKLGYYRNGKFWIYKDTLNKSTIGYGHLVLPDEDFSAGISEMEADTLLSRDLANAVLQVQSLKLNVPDDWKDFLVIMVFQLGINGVKKFRKMISALESKNYSEAVIQVRDSIWYLQTPNRINDMVKELKKNKGH